MASREARPPPKNFIQFTLCQGFFMQTWICLIKQIQLLFITYVPLQNCYIARARECSPNNILQDRSLTRFNLSLLFCFFEPFSFNFPSSPKHHTWIQLFLFRLWLRMISKFNTTSNIYTGECLWNVSEGPYLSYNWYFNTF